jgi:hypothetical protein
MAVRTTSLNESYYPADRSEPVLDTTVAGILRDAARHRISSRSSAAIRIRASAGAGPTASCLTTRSIARALLGRFAPGERVAAWAPNIPEWEVVEFGAGSPG